MGAQDVTQQQVIDELRTLEPNRWFEVLDFIGFLKERATRQTAASGARELTARTLVQSAVVGLWADREDMGSSLDFARRVRRDAECRRRAPSDPS